jgi:hypothetical protein
VVRGGRDRQGRGRVLRRTGPVLVVALLASLGGTAAYADPSVIGDGSVVDDGDYIGSANPDPDVSATAGTARDDACSPVPGAVTPADAADAQTRLVGQTPTGPGTWQYVVCAASKDKAAGRDPAATGRGPAVPARRLRPLARLHPGAGHQPDPPGRADRAAADLGLGPQHRRRPRDLPADLRRRLRLRRPARDDLEDPGHDVLPQPRHGLPPRVGRPALGLGLQLDVPDLGDVRDPGLQELAGRGLAAALVHPDRVPAGGVPHRPGGRAGGAGGGRPAAVENG